MKGQHTSSEQENQSPDQTTGSEPFSLKRFGRDFADDVFNVNSSLPGTFYDLFVSPGIVVTSYFKNHGRYMKPLRFAFLIGGFYVLIATSFVDFGEIYSDSFQNAFRESFAQSRGQSLDSVEIPGWVLEYIDRLQRLGVLLSTEYLAINLIFIMGPALTLTSYVMFRDYKNRLIQHAVLNMYAMGLSTVISMLPLIVIIIGGGRSTVSDYAGTLATLCSTVYFLWAYKNYFGTHGIEAHARSLISLLLGFLLYLVFSLVIHAGGAAIWQFVL